MPDRAASDGNRIPRAKSRGSAISPPRALANRSRVSGDRRRSSRPCLNSTVSDSVPVAATRFLIRSRVGSHQQRTQIEQGTPPGHRLASRKIAPRGRHRRATGVHAAEISPQPFPGDWRKGAHQDRSPDSADLPHFPAERQSGHACGMITGRSRVVPSDRTERSAPTNCRDSGEPTPIVATRAGLPKVMRLLARSLCLAGRCRDRVVAG